MSSSAALVGRGAGLVRLRSLAARVQDGLERLYRVDRTADVGDYLEPAEDGQREALLLEQDGEGDVFLAVRLPRLETDAPLDALCQVIEGVSHFVYVLECIRTERTVTQLELELQAEVDKWVVLAASTPDLDAARSALLRACLYERVVYADGADTDFGQRYRLANEAAHRFVRRLERDYVDRARYVEMRAVLRRYFRLGQQDKLRLGRAA